MPFLEPVFFKAGLFALYYRYTKRLIQGHFDLDLDTCRRWICASRIKYFKAAPSRSVIKYPGRHDNIAYVMWPAYR